MATFEERNKAIQARAQAARFRRPHSELRATLDEADALSRRSDLNPGQRDRLNFLLSKISVLRSLAGDRRARGARIGGALTVEERGIFEYLNRGDEDFREFLRSEAGKELRDITEGTQGPLSWTATGGYLVPQEYYDTILEGMAQADPLLDENNVRLITRPGPPPAVSQPLQARPWRIVGWDLSTITAKLVAEGGQAQLVSQPAVTSATLNGYLYRSILRGSFAWEEDAFPEDLELMTRAYAVAFARGIGKDLLSGSGSAQPQGLLTGAVDSTVTTGAAGVLALADFNSIYFSVNRAYRASPKCAWVMSDTVYQMARNAKDSSNRPLLSIERDEERIMGKRVLVSPSMPSTAGSKGIVFGDLAHFAVRLSPMSVRRAKETVSTGGYLSVDYIGLMRADSAVIDATSGTTPPIVFATLHS